VAWEHGLAARKLWRIRHRYGNLRIVEWGLGSIALHKWIGIFSWIEMGLSVVIGMALAASPAMVFDRDQTEVACEPGAPKNRLKDPRASSARLPVKIVAERMDAPKCL
jgi:hypothetical protein